MSKESARKAGWDVTGDELPEELFGAMELNDEELDSVAGGNAAGPGGCQRYFYAEQCTATVERYSWCGVSDWCSLIYEKYTAIK